MRDTLHHKTIQIVLQLLVTNNLTMEIKIFYNGEELTNEVSDPNKINDLMNDVRDALPNVINNIEHISFLKEHMRDGK